MVALTKQQLKSIDSTLATVQKQVGVSQARYQEVIGPGSAALPSDKLSRGKALGITLEGARKSLTDCQCELEKAQLQTTSSTKLLGKVKAALTHYDGLQDQLEFQITCNHIAEVESALSNSNRVMSAEVKPELNGVEFGSREALENSIKQFRDFSPENNVDAQASYQRFSSGLDSLQRVFDLSDKALDAAEVGKHDKAAQYIKKIDVEVRQHCDEYSPHLKSLTKHVKSGTSEIIANARLQGQPIKPQGQAPKPPAAASSMSRVSDSGRQTQHDDAPDAQVDQECTSTRSPK